MPLGWLPMRQLLTNTFIMIAAMFVAAWMLTPGGDPSSGRSLDVTALTGKGEEVTTNIISGTGNNGSYAVSGANGTTVIRRDASGRFHLTAQVNGEDAPFLIDTGADTVALTVADAERMHIDFNPGNFQPIGKTASGTAYGAVVEIETLRLGGMELHNAHAVVLDGLETNLLGQSVLQQVGKVEIEGDQMVIHPR